MTKRENYSGIDCFRFIAILLIVANHTSPLGSFSDTADFILTRVIARVAVPFFFTTSGFFLISRYSRSTEKLWRFVKKTTLIYAAAIVLYLPINIYNGYFDAENLLPNIIRDIVFDGTLYHLWYLPAAIIGGVTAWCLVKKLSFKRAFVISAALYAIGMLGDSYYGISEHAPVLRGFYELVFQLFDQTRNGIFFAPVFFVLGGYLADRKHEHTFKAYVIGSVIAFAFMLTEALALRSQGLPRHDSMYLFLLPLIYCLFSALLFFRGQRRARLRTLSLVVYIIHPLVIVALRLLARLTHLEALLIENSLVHYLAVCAASIAAGLVLMVLWSVLRPKRDKPSVKTDRAYIELDLNALEHNVNVINAALPPDCRLMAVMKAEAYGHGMFEVATFLEQKGVSAFAVAAIDEGISLRKFGISGEILILGYTAPHRASELRKYDLTQTLIGYEYAVQLNEQGQNIKAHIAVDTGMHRLGFPVEDSEKLAAAFSLRHIKVTGIFTHLSSADSIDAHDTEYTQQQIQRFYWLLDRLKDCGIAIPKVHIQSSYGLLNYPELKCDYVRAGLLLYGILSSPDDETRLKLDLKPVLSLKSRVVLLRKVRQGEGVGYNRAFTAERDSVIAVLPLGYADGVPRNLSSENGCVLICGQKAPIVGKICMDQLAVDVTDIPEVKTGSVATLIGRDGQFELTAPAVAESANTISNELLSRMGRRLCLILS